MLQTRLFSGSWAGGRVKLPYGSWLLPESVPDPDNGLK